MNSNINNNANNVTYSNGILPVYHNDSTWNTPTIPVPNHNHDLSQHYQQQHPGNNNVDYAQPSSHILTQPHDITDTVSVLYVYICTYRCIDTIVFV